MQSLKNYSINEFLIIQSAQTNFWAFCCHVNPDFFQTKRRFFKPIAFAFQSVVDNYIEGRAIKISISMPPRAGKSYITSLFAAYWLGRFPELSVMRNTCTATLYDKFSYDTRAIVRSDRFRDVFPRAQLATDKQNLGGWNLSTSKQVGYFGSGVGGTIIGFGANLAITDDLYKSMSDALSSTVREGVKQWKESAHDSRKEKNCPEIYIGTRWTKNDIIGEVMDSGDLDACFVVQALDENDNTFCDDVKTTEEYRGIRDRIARYIWMAEYQQEPYEVEGLLLPLSSLQFDDLSRLDPATALYKFAVGDPADVGGDKFSSVFLWLSQSGAGVRVYVRRVMHNTHGIMGNTPRIMENIKQERIDEVFMESNGVGLAAIVDLKNTMKQGGATKLTPFPSTEQKEVRILSNFEFIRTHFVFDQNYKSDPEYRSFIADLTGYVAGAKNQHSKDAIDVLSTAATIVKYKFSKFIY